MTSHGGTNVLSCTHIVFLQSCKRNPGHRGCAFRWHRSVIVGSLCAAVTPIEAPNSVLFWTNDACRLLQERYRSSRVVRLDSRRARANKRVAHDNLAHPPVHSSNCLFKTQRDNDCGSTCRMRTCM